LLGAADDLGDPPVALAPQHLREGARRIDQQDFLDAGDAAVIGDLGLAIVKPSRRGENLDE
jgi:hypothetical protein